jgi:hypothetical protein
MIIESLRSPVQSHESHPIHQPVAYFYCNRNEEQRRDPTMIMQAILKQLSLLLSESHDFRETYGLPRPVVTKYNERIKEDFSSGALRLQECKELILSLLDMNPQTTIVIDALDECDPTKRGQFMEVLKTIIISSKTLVKIFISSRGDGDIVLRLDEVPNLYIKASDNKADIERFIRREIALSSQGSRLLRNDISGKLKERIINTLVENAQGM